MSYYDEYYCPHCGATLNDQPGFDPEAGTWTCTECGQLLMDDDVYNGDTYEGVAWFCDECGALLNKQSGFSDSYGSWVCTECGHRNGTTEEDIISEPEFTCPNCGTALDNQSCFDKYEDDWECTECGAHLHHGYSSDEYSVVEEPRNKCPNCGSDLDEQWGYSEYSNDWDCSECGSHLHRDYSSDDYEVVKNKCPNCGANLDKQWCYAEYEDDWECTECGAKLHRDYSGEEYDVIEDDDEDDDDDGGGDESYSSNESNYHQPSSNSNTYSQSARPSYDYETSKTGFSQSASKSEKKSHWKRWLAVLLIAIIAIAIVCAYHELKLRIPVGYSSEELVGKKYAQVVNSLEASGFTNVSTKEISDLPIEQEEYENLVTSVKIGNMESFNADSKFPSNFTVLVTYHTLQRFAAPLSSKEAKGQSYIDVEEQFKNAGFSNIRFEVEYDIITGWITDDGEVKAVSVNGDEKYSSGSLYRVDAEIVITYHTWKKNKPN